MSSKRPGLTLGQNIRETRIAAGLTQEVVAERAGIRQSDLSGIETGKRGASVDMLQRLATALETTASDLMKGL